MGSQNESEVATGEIDKTSRKGGFPDFRRFWDDFFLAHTANYAPSLSGGIKHWYTAVYDQK